MSDTANRTRFIAIGSMLFALFFGAGNLIFPAAMGQAAGENVWWAVLGFCVRALLHGVELHGDRSLLRHPPYGHGVL